MDAFLAGDVHIDFFWSAQVSDEQIASSLPTIVSYLPKRSGFQAYVKNNVFSVIAREQHSCRLFLVAVLVAVR